MHILIVEDDEIARDYLAKALREVGHTVDVAGNGLEGLHLASSIAVDLAIVDRMLPKLDGLALVQSLRATGRKMPVLILSALEFQLLEFMMRHSGQVVTRTMLLEGVWDYHFDPQTNVIDVHISRLRQAIDKDFDKPLLHTVRGAGYSLREAE